MVLSPWFQPLITWEITHMGSDDLFKKRKARQKEELERKKATRGSHKKILIVCEGSKTEPLYFEEIRTVLGLNSAVIEIDGSCDSSPKSVVEHAYNLYVHEKNSGDAYDKVFCVFDRDEHTTFHSSIEFIEHKNIEFLRAYFNQDDEIFICIISEPSFEYWYLLHYLNTTKPFTRVGKKSASDRVIDDLKIYYPEYEKNSKGFYKKSLREETLDAAIAASTRIYNSAKTSKTYNPSTNVHILVNELISLKEQQ